MVQPDEFLKSFGRKGRKGNYCEKEELTAERRSNAGEFGQSPSLFGLL